MKSLAKYISYLALGALAASCADDGLADKGKTTLEADTPYYINLRLVTENDNFTRAGDEGGESQGTEDGNKRPGTLIDGDHNEHDIHPKAHNFALFFDEDDKYITYADLYSVNEPGVSDGKKTNDPGYDHGAENPDENGVPVEATYSCRFYGFANRKPKKVLVVANANNKIYKQLTNFPGWDIEDVMKQVWEEKGRLEIDKTTGKAIYTYTDDPYDYLGFCKISADGKIVEDRKSTEKTTTYFTMTNSSYIDEDGNLYCATEIPDDVDLTQKYITTDPNEADQLKPVLVYLERMVSKYDMSLMIDAKKYIPVSAPNLDVCVYENGEFKYYDYPWGIEFLGWGLNGLETKSYIFKNIDKSGDWLTHPGWNSPDYKRSFWSVDPHYYKQDSEYPWQFDDAKDKYDIEHPMYYERFRSYDETDKAYGLTYYPLTHFCTKINDDGTVTDGFTYNKEDAVFYTPENTFVPGLQVDRTRGTRAYELAGTHLLIAARLLVGPNYEPFDGNIYRNRVGVCYIDEVSMFEDYMNAVNYKLTSQKYIYYKYYPWDENEVSDFHRNKYDYAMDVRAVSEGQYALYYQDPEDGNYYELTSEKLYELAYNGGKKENGRNPMYRLWRDADALNADGKVIPWIMYNDPDDDKPEGYEPCQLYLLKKEGDRPVIERGEDIDDMKLKLQYKRFNDTKKEDEWVPFNNNEDDKDNNDIQSIFYEIWGLADDYNHGLMYYAVPIYAQEYTGLPASGDVKQLEDNDSGFDDPSFYYYYGVIRNNWYNFTLHSIGNLGIPVSNPGKPIVPNYNNKKNQVKVEMEVLPMHMQDIYVTIP